MKEGEVTNTNTLLLFYLNAFLLKMHAIRHPDDTDMRGTKEDALLHLRPPASSHSCCFQNCRETKRNSTISSLAAIGPPHYAALYPVEGESIERGFVNPPCLLHIHPGRYAGTQCCLYTGSVTKKSL